MTKNGICPVKNACDVIGGKWRLRLIDAIGLEKRRFGELKRLVPDISEKMLIQELKALVGHQVLNKKSYPEIPPRVEYWLTQKGEEILPIIALLKEFGSTH